MSAVLHQHSFSTQSTQSKFFTASRTSQQKKNKMSITQTYYLAHTARSKLSQEASRADHDLRLLVGHANLLDSLMLQLAEAEAEQERWFNQSVKGAAEASEEQESRHIQWADTIVEEPEQDWDIEDAETDSDTDSEYDHEEDIEMTPAPRSKITVAAVELEADDEDYDSEEDNEDLALVRTPSRSPPELLEDFEEDDSEDDLPQSPPQPTLEFSETERRQIATTSFYDARKQSAKPLSETEQLSFFEDGYYLPQRTSQQQMIEAF